MKKLENGLVIGALLLPESSCWQSYEDQSLGASLWDGYINSLTIIENLYFNVEVKIFLTNFLFLIANIFYYFNLRISLSCG